MTWTCAVCGTLATPANALLVDGGRIVHRGCVDEIDDQPFRHGFDLDPTEDRQP